MVRRAKSSAAIRAEMENLKQELRAVEEKEATRLGALAVKAGLHEINVAEPDLLAALKDIAARFRPPQKPTGKTA